MLLTDIPFLLCCILTLLVIYAMVTDLTSFRIPNKVNLALLLLFPLALLLPESRIIWTHSLLAFAVVFATGYIIFALKIAGGGDVKLLAVLALWVGWGKPLLLFVVWMGLLGGLLTIALLISRKVAPAFFLKWGGGSASIPKVLSYGEPIPYGIAIGCAFLYLLWTGQLPVYG